MIRLLLILALILPLGGCATLTVAAVGTAVGIGIATGGGRFIGQEGLKGLRDFRTINRKCNRLKTELWRKRCINRMRYLLHYHN